MKQLLFRALDPLNVLLVCLIGFELVMGLLILDSELRAAQAAEPVPPLIDLVPDNASWGTVKKRLYTKVHHEQEITFYCGCLFNPERNEDGDKNTITLGTCGMSSLTSARAKKVEAEHIVTAYAIGVARGCWTEAKELGKPGRDYCLKNDKVFKKAHNDLHNLVPSVGFVNGARSNIPFGMVEGEERKYGDCDIEVDRGNGAVEPKPDVRGDIGRIHFYMEHQYGATMSDEQRGLMLWWHRDDPVDDWERTRDDRIFAIQDSHNPFVTGAATP